MDLHLIETPPSFVEQSAVDALLGPADSGWDGGTRNPLDGHIAYGGSARAASLRHLLLPALHALQDAVGWISPGGLGYVSQRLSVPPAEAYGVAGFYALLPTEERPPRIAHVCDDVPCRLAGAGELIQDLEQRLGPPLNGNADMAWDTSPCLGRCEQAPAVFLQLAGARREVLGRASAATVLDRMGSDVAIPAPVLAVAAEVAERGVPSTVLSTGPPQRTLEEHRSNGGYRALQKAISLGAEGVLGELETSRLRGRGGAAFPAAVKWRAVAAAEAPTKYVVCNADESEPGTFKDRLLLERNPFDIIEAMTIAGITVGAERGYVYLRGEYPDAEATILDGIGQARSAGLLGADVAGSGAGFDIELRRGGGAYICGEETALFNSIEGYRGEPRQKPPYPTEAGLFGTPTLVNNVETLANIPHIVLVGGATFAATGTADSTGTRVFCVSGHVGRPGAYEVPLGTTLGDLLDLAGGVSGELRTILLGGAAGSFVGPDRLDLPLSFEAARDAGVTLGSGAVIAMNDGTDFGTVLRRIAAFFRDESCGRCVPCRVGTVRQEEAIVRITGGSSKNPGEDRRLLGEVDRAMADASICGLGHTAGSAIRSALALGLLDGSRRP